MRSKIERNLKIQWVLRKKILKNLIKFFIFKCFLWMTKKISVRFFALMILIVSHWRTKYWNQDYHVFWSSVGWDPENQCSPVRNGETTVHRSCCGPESTGPFQLYNEQTHQCCTDFSIESIGSCWKIWNKSKIARNCLSLL